VNNFERYQTFVVQAAAKEGPIDPAVVGSASFAYGDPEVAEAIFEGSVQKPLYARMGNPTNAYLERLIAGIDEAEGAMATSSGMGAIAMVSTAMLEAGDEVVCVGGLFGGSYAFFSQTLPRFGIKARFYKDADDVEITPQTKMIYCESIGNPNMKIVDFEVLGKLAKEKGLLFVVDNTLTPLLFEPFKWGADLIVYSTTKIIAGHSQALGGAVAFRGVREELLERFSCLKPFIEKLGEKAYMGALKKRSMRDFGMSMNAYAAHLTILGLQTLALRLQRSCENTLDIVRALKEEFNILHPLLSQPERLDRYFPCSCGQMFSIDLGSKERAFGFLKSLKIAYITANLGDARTLAIHPRSTIYRDFSEEECRFLGVSDGLVRVSVGLESKEAIIEDFLRSKNA